MDGWRRCPRTYLTVSSIGRSLQASLDEMLSGHAQNQLATEAAGCYSRVIFAYHATTLRSDASPACQKPFLQTPFFRARSLSANFGRLVLRSSLVPSKPFALSQRRRLVLNSRSLVRIPSLPSGGPRTSAAKGTSKNHRGDRKQTLARIRTSYLYLRRPTYPGITCSSCPELLTRNPTSPSVSPLLPTSYFTARDRFLPIANPIPLLLKCILSYA